MHGERPVRGPARMDAGPSRPALRPSHQLERPERAPVIQTDD